MTRRRKPQPTGQEYEQGMEWWEAMLEKSPAVTIEPREQDGGTRKTVEPEPENRPNPVS